MNNVFNDGAVALYLDLLKRVLTNTLQTPEPDVDLPQEAYVMRFWEHYVRGPALSMLPIARMDNIQACVVDVLRTNVSGDLIETGVWRGGAAIFMRAVLKAFGVTDRTVWVADSFKGLPQPDPSRFPREAKTHAGPVMRDAFAHFAVSAQEVRRNFAAFGLLDRQTQFIEGWFNETLPRVPIERLAVIRLDGDYYQSTIDALRNLYDKLSVGGYVIVDDYGEDEWTHCRQAVDEFRAARNITDSILPVDRRCFYWKRSR